MIRLSISVANVRFLLRFIFEFFPTFVCVSLSFPTFGPKIDPVTFKYLFFSPMSGFGEKTSRKKYYVTYVA